MPRTMLKSWWPVQGSGTTLSGLQVQLQAFEEYGASFLAHLTAAIKEESWKLRLLSLAWTAGPVTFLALFIGFWVGYGKAPPKELFLYFGAYTVIAGLISIIAGIVQRATVTARRRAVENMLSEVIAKFPDLIVSIRNLTTFSLTAEERRLRGAVYLLGDPDATESSIETAVEDLTGSSRLARRFRRLESYRKKGLMGLVQEEAALIGREYQDLAPEIRRRSAHAAALLESRLGGRIPSKRLGLRRRYGFLKRITEVMESGDLEQLRLVDAEELLKLILELLMDRRLAILRWKLTGDHALVAAAKQLERLRRQQQRLARKRRLAKYRIIELLDRRINAGPTPAFPESVGVLKEEGMFPFTLAAVPEFATLETNLQAGENHAELLEQLRQVKGLSRELEQLAEKLRTAQERFTRVRRQYRESFHTVSEADSALNVRLERETIRFSSEDKIHFARYLHFYLANLTTNRERTRVVIEGGGEHDQEDSRALTAEELKGMVLRIFAEFERLLDLGEEAVLESLEASAAINVSAIETSLSRRTKIGWLQAMIEELEENELPLALRAAQRMVDHLQSRLPPAVVNTLIRRYQLPREKLQSLRPSAGN